MLNVILVCCPLTTVNVCLAVAGALSVTPGGGVGRKDGIAVTSYCPGTTFLIKKFPLASVLALG
jgi:hypothetical protein